VCLIQLWPTLANLRGNLDSECNKRGGGGGKRSGAPMMDQPQKGPIGGLESLFVTLRGLLAKDPKFCEKLLMMEGVALPGPGGCNCAVTCRPG